MRNGDDLRVNSGRATAALIGVAVWMQTAAALASPVAVGWTTYLRSGPGYAFPAITELEHDTRVDLSGCDGDWCRVSTTGTQGFIDRAALALPRTLPVVPPARSDCVVVGQADNRGAIPTRFCSARPPTASASPTVR